MAAAAIKEICLLVNWNIYGFFLVKLSLIRFSLGLVPDIFGQIRHLDVSPNKAFPRSFSIVFRAIKCPPNTFGVQASCRGKTLLYWATVTRLASRSTDLQTNVIHSPRASHYLLN